ncbi:hypothetical protein [Aegicerativicinus sediminis]|uniref:hypothetical protein n=1 Tax=Aegicerativicinus sediminis TaxID=2893202 RepID=UPI001E3F02DF|nr:hypothetical protein [Aegicerativicinus sediminis]
MKLIYNLQSLVWSNIMTILMLDLESSKNVINQVHQNIINGTKPITDYSEQIKLAYEVYLYNSDILNAS